MTVEEERMDFWDEHPVEEPVAAFVLRSFRLSRATNARLDDAAAAQGITASAWIRDAIAAHLDEAQ